ncbi:MAG: hypothetical protein IJK26_02855, partial [Clostridia bacterium]|nr:hypothetical protein [Clostridia bacterium]
GANVYVDLRQSSNSLTIDEVYNYGNTVVSLVVDYRDFELDEEVMDEIEREQAEDNEQAQIDMAIKNYKENEVPR